MTCHQLTSLITHCAVHDKLHSADCKQQPAHSTHQYLDESAPYNSDDNSSRSDHDHSDESLSDAFVCSDDEIALTEEESAVLSKFAPKLAKSMANNSNNDDDDDHDDGNDDDDNVDDNVDDDVDVDDDDDAVDDDDDAVDDDGDDGVIHPLIEVSLTRPWPVGYRTIIIHSDDDDDDDDDDVGMRLS